MATSEFEGWLCKKLTSLDIDNDIYGSYITGILEDTEGDVEKKEALGEVLASLSEDSDSLCNDVFLSWKEFQNGSIKANEDTEKETNIEEIIAAHVGATATKMSQQRPTKSSEERSAVKQSVIAMYSSVHDEADDFEESRDAGSSHHNTVDSALEIMKNTNAERITQEQKAERLKQKEESVKKKAQDKADREMQKIKKAERKDKEKKRTQKKERQR